MRYFKMKPVIYLRPTLRGRRWRCDRAPLHSKKRKKRRKQTRIEPIYASVCGLNMMGTFSRRALDRIYSVVLLAVVVLSWSFVIYASRISAQWLLEKRTN